MQTQWDILVHDLRYIPTVSWVPPILKFSLNERGDRYHCEMIMNIIFQTLKIFLKICFHSYNIYNSSNKGYMMLTNLCSKHKWANFNRLVCVHMCAVVLGIKPRSLSILSKY